MGIPQSLLRSLGQVRTARGCGRSGEDPCRLVSVHRHADAVNVLIGGHVPSGNRSFRAFLNGTSHVLVARIPRRRGPRGGQDASSFWNAGAALTCRFPWQEINCQSWGWQRRDFLVFLRSHAFGAGFVPGGRRLYFRPCPLLAAGVRSLKRALRWMSTRGSAVLLRCWCGLAWSDETSDSGLVG